MERSGRHTTPGRHAGPVRREPDDEAPSGVVKALLPLALGITAAVVAWGYLVYVAIDFGTAARDGETRGWWLLGLATLGAIACLFVGMVLVTRVVQRMRAPAAPPAPPRPPGGRRIAR